MPYCLKHYYFLDYRYWIWVSDARSWVRHWGEMNLGGITPRSIAVPSFTYVYTTGKKWVMAIRPVYTWV